MDKNTSPRRVLISAHVDQATRLRLRELAEQHDRSLAAEVRIAIRRHLERERETAALGREER
jgi:predicted transcriptional regulator